jgi:hypothetical protein
MAAVGGREAPAGGLGAVTMRAFTGAVHFAQGKLRVRIALIGEVYPLR